MHIMIMKYITSYLNPILEWLSVAFVIITICYDLRRKTLNFLVFITLIFIPYYLIGFLYKGGAILNFPFVFSCSIGLLILIAYLKGMKAEVKNTLTYIYVRCFIIPVVIFFLIQGKLNYPSDIVQAWLFLFFYVIPIFFSIVGLNRFFLLNTRGG